MHIAGEVSSFLRRVSVVLAALAAAVLSALPAAAAPDLIPQSVSFSRTSMASGESVTVWVTVWNGGTTSAAATTTMIRMNTSASSSSPSDPIQQGVATGALAAGASTTVSATFSLSSPGTYYAHVYVDNYSVLAQSSTGNDIAHQGAVTVSAPQLPDLVPTNISFSSTSLTAGQSVTVYVTVANNGGGSAGPTTTMIRLNTSSSSSSPSDPIQQGVSTPSLGSGASTTVSATFTLSSPGTYYAHAYVDNYSALSQTSVANDARHQGTVTVATLQQPDLVPTNITFSSTSVAAGSAVTVFVTVANFGGGSAGATTTMIRLNTSSSSSSPSDPIQQGVSTPFLAAGASTTVSATFTLSTPGTYYAHAYVDNYSTLSQSDVTNDVRHQGAVTVSASQYPDVLPTSVTFSSASIAPGGSVTVNVTIKNQGDAPAAATTTAIRMNTSASSSSPSDPLTQNVSTPALSVGASTTVTATFTLNAAGTYYAHVYADNFSVLSQSNTANDIAHQGTVTVSSSQKPDVLPTNITFSSASIAPGGSVTVNVTIKNQGDAPAAATTTAIRMNTSASSSSSSDPLTQNVSTPALSVGASTTVTATFTLSAAGTYYAHVYADNFSVLSQSNTANDIAHQGTVTVSSTQKPDVLPTSVTFSSASIAPGGSVTVNVTIKNQGDAPAAATTTAIRMNTSASSSSPSDPLTQNVATPALSIGASTTITATFTLNATGTYYAHVYADNFSVLSQSNTANDIAHQGTVTVSSTQKPDVLPTSVTFSSASIAPGGSVTVNVTIKNQGDAPAAATTTAIRMNTSASSSSPSDPLTQNVATPALSVGASTTVTATFTLNAAGTYYAHVYADNFSVLAQSNTANDIAHQGTVTVSSTQKPDVLPTSVTFSSASIAPGGSVTVNVTIKNQGDAPAAATTTAVRMNTSASSSSTSDPLRQNVPTPALAAGASTTVNATFTLSAAGTYYAHVYADNGNILNQSNIANDIVHKGTVTVSSDAKPDLVPANVAFSRTAIAPGESVTVDVTVRNLGDGPAAATTTAIRMNTNPSSSTPSELLRQNVSTPALSPGASATVSAAFILPATGTYYAHVYVDNASVLSQSNSTNDVVHQGVVLVAERTPDLIVQNLSVDPSAGEIGGTPTVAFRIRNAGSAGAKASVAKIRLGASSANVADAEPLLAQIDVPALDVDVTHDVRKVVTIPQGVTGGTKYVWAIVDSDRTAGQSEAAQQNDRASTPFLVGADNPNLPAIVFTADPDTVRAGQTTTLRWTTTGATTVSIDNDLGPQALNGTLPVKPIRTTTYTLTAVGPGGTATATAIVTVTDSVNELVFGGLKFKAESIVRTQDGYKLTGSAITIQDVLSYSGTLELRNADASGTYRVIGTGVLHLPRVKVPGFGEVVLYDGSFSLPLKNGQLFEFLEQFSQFRVAGWKVKIDSLAFLADGVRMSAHVRVPQYTAGLSALSVAANVDVTQSRGVEVAARVRISRIGLAGALWLENVDIAYDGARNAFEGSGTLRSATIGFGVAVTVLDGCPNSASVTLSRVPITLGTTGLQLVNYGVDATGLCGSSPFGVGVHTDITAISNPDPKLFSFEGVNAMYFPLTKLRGGGKVRFLYQEVGDAKVFFNYADEDVDCDDGLCFEAHMTLPKKEEPWLVGNLEARVMLDPFRIYGSPRLTLQVPTPCADLDDLSRWEKVIACPLIWNACHGKHPCVICEADLSLSVQPTADPVASFSGKVLVYGNPFGATLTYSEGGDRRFHFHLGIADRANTMTAAAAAAETLVVAAGTSDAYIGFGAQPGISPNATLISPSGQRYGRSGGPGVEYLEDASYGAGVFLLRNPEPGTWRVEGAPGDVVSYVPAGPASVSIQDVIAMGSDFNVQWQSVNAKTGAKVTLTYAGSVKGPDVGLIADSIPANNSARITEWATSNVATGTYYVRAYLRDKEGNVTVDTFRKPVSIAGRGAPRAPLNLEATVSNANATLKWRASSSAGVAGYVVVQESPDVAPVQIPVGDVLSTELTNLDRSRGYTFSVSAYDDNGRRSVPSNTVRVSWSPCQLAATVVAPTLMAKGDGSTFSASALLTGGCTEAPAYQWSFGDGASASGPEPAHSYEAPGIYSWTMTAAADGKTATRSGTVRVESARCSIRVASPARGAMLERGDETLIAWETSGPCSGDVRVDLMRDGVVEAALAIRHAETSLRWVPADQLHAGDYYIRVRDAGNDAFAGLSQEFTIGGITRRRASRH